MSEITNCLLFKIIVNLKKIIARKYARRLYLLCSCNLCIISLTQLK